MVAETFTVAWRRLEDVPTGDGALPWLLATARKQLANRRRSAAVRDRHATGPFASDAGRRRSGRRGRRPCGAGLRLRPAQHRRPRDARAHRMGRAAAPRGGRRPGLLRRDVRGARPSRPAAPRRAPGGRRRLPGARYPAGRLAMTDDRLLDRLRSLDPATPERIAEASAGTDDLRRSIESETVDELAGRRRERRRRVGVAIAAAAVTAALLVPLIMLLPLGEDDPVVGTTTSGGPHPDDDGDRHRRSRPARPDRGGGAGARRHRHLARHDQRHGRCLRGDRQHPHRGLGEQRDRGDVRHRLVR